MRKWQRTLKRGVSAFAAAAMCLTSSGTSALTALAQESYSVTSSVEEYGGTEPPEADVIAEEDPLEEA